MGKEEFIYKELAINYASCLVQISGKQVTLSPTELKLLFFFSRNPGRVYSRSQILDHVWGDETLSLIARLTCISGVYAVKLRRIWKVRSIF